MMTYIEPTLWAQKQFGQAHLNDPRCTQRLVALAASLAEHPGVPVSKLIISPADMEGAYLFIRNEQIKAEDIAEAGFYVTAQEALEQQTLLVLEDTTSLSYSHRSIRDELGHSNQGNRHRAMFVRSTLLFAPGTQAVVGLIEQQQRFLVRSMQSRHIEEHDNRLYDYASKLLSAGEKVLEIPQKGGRKARKAHLDIKYAPVTLKSPANKKEFDNIPLYYVGCIE